MRFLKRFVFIAAVVFLGGACGIEEHYYLPQVPSGTFNLNTEATITLPPNFLSDYHYASGYRIFYRIYLSNSGSVWYPNTISSISALNSDISFFSPFTDPINPVIISSTTFANRRFYELSPGIGTEGGTLDFEFPTGIGVPPTVSINGVKHDLRRSNALNLPAAEQFFFINTDEINNNENSSINADVVIAANNEYAHAYVAMYIVAIGTNPEDQTPIISSKPTLINVFKLPNIRS